MWDPPLDGKMGGGRGKQEVQATRAIGRFGIQDTDGKKDGNG